MRRDLPWALFTGSSRVWRTTDAGTTWRSLGTEVADGEWTIDVVRSVALTPADDDRLIIGKGSEVFTSSDGGAPGGPPHGEHRQQRRPLAAWTPNSRWPAWPGLRTASLSSSAPPTAATPGTPPTPACPLRDPGGELAPPWIRTSFLPAPMSASTGHPTAGLSWVQVGDGLPAASIHDLRIAEDGSRIVVATHGRGIWELAFADPVGEAPTVTLDGPERRGHRRTGGLPRLRRRSRRRRPRAAVGSARTPGGCMTGKPGLGHGGLGADPQLRRGWRVSWWPPTPSTPPAERDSTHCS